MTAAIFRTGYPACASDNFDIAGYRSRDQYFVSMLYVVCLPFEVRKEFIVLSVVNDNTSGEKGPQLVRLGIFADSIAAFSPIGFCGLGIVLGFRSLKMYTVYSPMSLYSAGGRRKKEKKKRRNCGDYSMPGHTIECTDTTGWLDSSNTLSPATSKQGINSDIPFISHMDEIYHGSNQVQSINAVLVKMFYPKNQSHKLISPLHMASVIPSFSTKCCQRGPPLSFRHR